MRYLTAMVSIAILLAVTGCQTNQDLVDSLRRLIDAAQEELDQYPGGTETVPEARKVELVEVGEIHRRPGFFGKEFVLATEWGLWAYDVEDVDNPLANETVFDVAITGGYYPGASSDADPLRDFKVVEFGRRIYTNPEFSATWFGKARAITSDLEAVEGSSRVNYYSINNSVDVLIADWDNDLRSLYWSDLPVINGAFSTRIDVELGETNRMNGAFYGDAFEGAAGNFRTHDMIGVFGALREEAMRSGPRPEPDDPDGGDATAP